MGTLKEVVIGHRLGYYVVINNKLKLTEGMAYDQNLS